MSRLDIHSHSLPEVDMELGSSNCPILYGLRPLLLNAVYSAENEFEQGVFGSESAFSFCVFSDLAMEALDSIGGIDYPPDFTGIFEIGRKVFPVILPGGEDGRVFLSPFFIQL